MAAWVELTHRGAQLGLELVDSVTEQRIQEALDVLMHDKRHTVFVIAQRISTVRDADMILLLDGGKLVASGTHEQLLENSPLYGEILGSQLRESQRPLPTGVL